MIKTFADCPNRKEHWKGDIGYGEDDTLEELCPDGSLLSMRYRDYSICRNMNNRSCEGHSCQIGRGSEVAVSVSKWCEAALCAKLCPRGYVR